MPLEPQPYPAPPSELEALGAGLRALPQPPVPSDLEDRLLATIPATVARPRRRWPVAIGLISAAAAALTVLAWRGRESHDPIAGPGTRPSAHQVASQSPNANARTTDRRQAQRVLDGPNLPAFVWPLSQESASLTVSTPIPADLFD